MEVSCWRSTAGPGAEAGGGRCPAATWQAAASADLSGAGAGLRVGGGGEWVAGPLCWAEQVVMQD